MLFKFQNDINFTYKKRKVFTYKNVKFSIQLTIVIMRNRTEYRLIRYQIKQYLLTYLLTYFT